MEQAKLGDQVACPCKGSPHRIVSAASATFVDGIPVARIGDRSSCGATIISGVDWYAVEGAPAAIHGSRTSCGGVVIAASSALTGQPSGGLGQSSSPIPQGPRFNRRVIFHDDNGGPLVNFPYRLVLNSGDIREGRTNAQGEAELIDSSLASSAVEILVRRD